MYHSGESLRVTEWEYSPGGRHSRDSESETGDEAESVPDRVVLQLRTSCQW